MRQRCTHKKRHAVVHLFAISVAAAVTAAPALSQTQNRQSLVPRSGPSHAYTVRLPQNWR